MANPDFVPLFDKLGGFELYNESSNDSSNESHLVAELWHSKQSTGNRQYDTEILAVLWRLLLLLSEKRQSKIQLILSSRQFGPILLRDLKSGVACCMETLLDFSSRETLRSQSLKKNYSL